MKVLMICTEKLPVPPILGGAIQTYLAGILPILSKEHDITVLGTNDPSLPNEEHIDGIRYVRIPGKVFELYKEGVTEFLSSEQFDLVHIFNRPRLILPVRQHAPHSKITLSMHNDMFFPEKIDPVEAQMALHEISQIVTVSDYIGNVIKDLYPESVPKIKTIYSGVDIERFLPIDHPDISGIRNELRKKHGLEDKTVILFAGRLSRNKGVDKLILAIPALAERFDNLALVIIGGNWFSQDRVTDYVAYIRALSKRLPIPVINTGYVSGDKIHEWYSAADLFVCTSQWQEPLARVHYEAMAAGLPIVTTERGGNPEVISARENGVVIKNPEDPNGFVEAITEVLSDKSLMTSMGKKGRDLALSQYTWDRVASQVLETWEEVSLEPTRSSYVAKQDQPQVEITPKTEEPLPEIAVTKITEKAVPDIDVTKKEVPPSINHKKTKQHSANHYPKSSHHKPEKQKKTKPRTQPVKQHSPLNKLLVSLNQQNLDMILKGKSPELRKSVKKKNDELSKKQIAKPLKHTKELTKRDILLSALSYIEQLNREKK
ncbi:glycosyltransferase family 4 protein [Litchfieldia salsa]|uniref:Spore coat protein SA n=1 Tax=Litchfieldia salsa TaxID=930152 RepID=A0A1H0QCK2_9BACI|nr:glycosyltransferase family 4 protein [Litchfieldia salsa]SDP15103.1 spore coat protein SA [Litchfieldia salsa]